MANEKLIDANEVKKKLRAVQEWFVGHPSSEQDKLAQAVVKMCIEEVKKLKPVDAVPVVRCKDCRHYMTIHCTCDGCCISDDWYCADGERRTDNEEE